MTVCHALLSMPTLMVYNNFLVLSCSYLSNLFVTVCYTFIVYSYSAVSDYSCTVSYCIVLNVVVQLKSSKITYISYKNDWCVIIVLVEKCHLEVSQ